MRNRSGPDQRGRRQTIVETRDGTGGGRSDQRVCSLSFSSSFRLPLFLQSTTTGGAGWGVSKAGGTTYCSHPPREVGGGGGGGGGLGGIRHSEIPEIYQNRTHYGFYYFLGQESATRRFSQNSSGKSNPSHNSQKWRSIS